MAIATLDDYIAAKKQNVLFRKTGSVTGVANMMQSIFAAAGNPGAGTLSAGNTANGIVPTDATAGFPIIRAFDGGAKGYLARVEFQNSVISDILLYDILFKAGAYAFNADVTLASQPSFSSRVPGGTDFKGLELFWEAVTAYTGNLSVQINYLDQDGGSGDTGVYASGIAPILGRCFQIPLAAGDNGVQRIDRVRCTVSTVGTGNIVVARPLGIFRVPVANFTDTYDFMKTGMPEVFADSALCAYIQADSTATGLPRLALEIANK